MAKFIVIDIENSLTPTYTTYDGAVECARQCSQEHPNSTFIVCKTVGEVFLGTLAALAAKFKH